MPGQVPVVMEIPLNRRPAPVYFRTMDLKRISTPYYASYKLLPIMGIGFLAVVFVMLLMSGALTQAPLFLAMPCVMAGIFYAFWKTHLSDLMDEVYDEGDFLLLKKNGEEDRVPIADIVSVDFSTNYDGSSPRITLTVRQPGKFGQMIAFAPPPEIHFSQPSNNAVADNLAARVQAARTRRAV